MPQSPERRLAYLLSSESLPAWNGLIWARARAPYPTRRPAEGRYTAFSGRVAHAVHHTALLVDGPKLHVARDNDEVEVEGGRVYLHLGARRDDAELR